MAKNKSESILENDLYWEFQTTIFKFLRKNMSHHTIMIRFLNQILGADLSGDIFLSNEVKEKLEILKGQLVSEKDLTHGGK